jgi:hypothetical protein
MRVDASAGASIGVIGDLSNTSDNVLYICTVALFRNIAALPRSVFAGLLFTTVRHALLRAALCNLNMGTWKFGLHRIEGCLILKQKVDLQMRRSVLPFLELPHSTSHTFKLRKIISLRLLIVRMYPRDFIWDYMYATHVCANSTNSAYIDPRD